MRNKALLLGLPLVMLGVSQAHAISFGTYDPRAMGMGGAGVASGASANAAFYNPALLAATRADEDFSLALPTATLRLTDPDELIDDLDTFQEEDYIGDFEAAINDYAPGDDDSKQAVIDAGNVLLDEFQALSDRALEGDGTAGAVIGVPGRGLGTAVFVSGRVVGGTLLNVTDGDIQAVEDVLDDVDNDQPTSIPDFTSTVDGRGVVLAEAGVSLARELDWAGGLAVGVTPKVVRVTTFDYAVDIETADIAVDEGTESENDYNVDLGVAKRWAGGFKGGLVVKDVLSKEYETVRNNTVKLAPQARVGLAHETGWTTLGLDVDLTESEPAGLESKAQYVAVGAELDALGWAQLRLGYRHNMANSDTSSYAAGVGLSPFGIHMDLTVTGSDREVGVGFQTGLRF